MKFFPRDDSTIRTAATLIGGLGLGAALMYVLDPDRGRRRRALARDKAVRAAHYATDRIDARARDWRNRVRGAAAQVQSITRHDTSDDAVLEERVRAEIGRAISTPGSVSVSANAGTVTLTGPVLAKEVDDLVSAARGVRGVHEVENRLEVYDSPGDVPALQGARGPRSKAERGADRWESADAES